MHTITHILLHTYRYIHIEILIYITYTKIHVYTYTYLRDISTSGICICIPDICVSEEGGLKAIGSGQPVYTIALSVIKCRCIAGDTHTQTQTHCKLLVWRRFIYLCPTSYIQAQCIAC